MDFAGSILQRLYARAFSVCLVKPEPQHVASCAPLGNHANRWSNAQRLRVNRVCDIRRWLFASAVALFVLAGTEGAVSAQTAPTPQQIQEMNAGYQTAMQECNNDIARLMTTQSGMWYTWVVIPHTCQNINWGGFETCTVGFEVWRADRGFAFTNPVDGGAYQYFCVNWSPAKNYGVPSKCEACGNPINVAVGNKFQHEIDYVAGDLELDRYYNSDSGAQVASLGAGWRTSYDQSLIFFSSTSISAVRPDGGQLSFTLSNGSWVSDSDVPDTLTQTEDAQGNLTGYQLFVGDTRQYETYSAAGNLLSISDESHVLQTRTYVTLSTATPISVLSTVTDAEGRTLTFNYDPSSFQLKSVTLPDGSAIRYTYTSVSSQAAQGYQLISVTWPDGSARSYVYDEQGLSASTVGNKLTGVIDESGTRYATYTYQSDGRAISTQHAGGVDLHSVSYASDNSGTQITYPLGLQANATYAFHQSVASIGTTSTNCGVGCSQNFKARTWDSNGYPASVTDFNGNITKTTYDVNGLIDQQIDASGSASQRTTNFTWNTTLRVPLTRAVLDANNNTVSNMQWVYNTTGQPIARCDIDPTNSAASSYTCSNTGTVPVGVRRSIYTYCTAVDGTQCPIVGLLLTATGPRTDTTQATTYSYYLASSAVSCGIPGAACYQAGDLHTVTDPAGHVTTMASYDADGRITRVTDANGVNTDLTYTPRGWLSTRTVGGAQTSFGYTPYGAVSSVTDPDGVTTSYGYDAAHRLVKITDAQGNTVQYTLDAAGDKTAEQTYDATGTVHKSLSRTFNTLGQLTSVVDGLNHTVFNASASTSYDANGNLVQSADGLGIQRQLGYDALNRLVQTLDNYNGTN